MPQANVPLNPLGRWRMGRGLCAFADSERHLGHILKAEWQWVAYDGTRLSEGGIGFRIIGTFPDMDSAKVAVEFVSIPTTALIRGSAGPVEFGRSRLHSVLDHHRHLEVWAKVNPDAFEDRAALVGAEIARIEGRVLDGQELYEKAIRSARKYGFVHNEAVANRAWGVLLRGARFREDRDDLSAG
jgi:hypothetical protein